MVKKFISHVMMAMLTLWSATAHALYVSDDVFIIEADKPFLSRQFYNDSQSTNMYLISMYQIDRPGKLEQAKPIPDGEVMYSPLQMVVNAGQAEYFKIFYRGPQDEQERYYRMVIREVPINAVKDGQNSKESMVSTVVALDTYLVIRPRKQKFDYAYDPSIGMLKNTGNTFFRVLINKGCSADNDDNAIVFNLLPNEASQHPLLKGEHQKYIVAFDKYIRVGTQCFDAETLQ